MARHKHRIMISIDPELNERFTKVCEELGMTKSGVISELLAESVPVLEKLARSKANPYKAFVGIVADKMSEISKDQ